MSEPKLDYDKNEMTLKPDPAAIVGQASLVFILFAVSIFAARMLKVAGLYTRFGTLLFFLMIVSAFVTGLALIYIAYVMFSRHAELKFEAGGMVDRLSPFRLGPILRKDVRKVKVVNHLVFGVALAVDLNPSGPAIARLGPISSFCYFFYALVFDGKIYFPLTWLGVTKHDLESRLMLYRQKVVTEEPTEVEERMDFNTPKDGFEREISAYQEIEITRPAYEKAEKSEDTPPPMTKEQAELMRKVNKIKKHVAETRLDSILCELYTDEISQWLEWEGHRDWPKPKELKDIKLVDNTINYQEVTFTYHGKRFHFGLRRNVGSSQEALLSVSYDGSLKIALKVTVEIGSLTPKKLEQYLQGEWEQEIKRLYDKIAELRGRRRSGFDEDDPITRTDVDIENTEELKRRFGV